MTTKCTECDGLYVWSRHGDVVPGGKDREEIMCPHCGFVSHSEMTSQFFFVREDTDDEVREYWSRHAENSQ